MTTPDDFEDFNDEADLEGLFKLLLKPPKVMVGAVLTEVAAYVIPGVFPTAPV